MERLMEEREGESATSLGEGPGGERGDPGAGEFQEGAKVMAGFPEGGLGSEGLEEEEPEGAPEGEEAIATVGAGGLGLEEIGGEERGEEELEFGDGGGTDGAEAAAERGQGSAEGGKEGSVHRAVVLPPY
jgi:hypothetical protein